MPSRSVTNEMLAANLRTISDGLLRLREENREDHRLLFQAQTTQGERLAVCESDLGAHKAVMRDLIKSQANGKARLHHQIGSLSTWIKILAALALGAGSFFLTKVIYGG